MENIIFVLTGVLLLLIFVLSLSVIHLRSIRDDINIRWYNISEKLQYRQDMIPNLIETARLKIPQDELKKHKELIDDTIEIRKKAARNTDTDSQKITVEHNLSQHISQIFNLGAKYNEFGRYINYLELQKDFAELRKNIQKMTNEYNKKVRSHNAEIKKIYNYIPAKLMKYGKKTIFEFE